MLLNIVHKTELEYTARVSESVMELRVAPRSDEHQTLRGFGLAVGPSASVFEHLDWLGNRVHHFSIVEFHEKLVIVAHSAVEVRPRATDLATVGERIENLELDYRLRDFVGFSGPVDRSDDLGALAKKLELSEKGPAGASVERVMRVLKDEIEYKKGVTDAASSVSFVLKERAGVCQDFAHVGIALLRALGIPARYVSGYLYRRENTELETHAWLEAYLPSIGWVAIDPTHGEQVSINHIAVATGRSYADVPPNRGTFRGEASESIKARVEITPIQEVPRTLLATRPAPLNIPIYREGPKFHREKLNYQLEQAQQQQQQQQQQ